MALNKPLPARIVFLFQKYINNECNSEELNELLDGLSDPSIDKHLDLITRSMWESVKKNDVSSISFEDERQLRAEAQLLIQRANYVPARRLAKFLKPRFYRNIAAAAVIALFIGIGATYMYKNDSATTIFSWSNKEPDTYLKSDTNHIKIIQLADGSKITMNASTSIGYVKNDFNRDKREVWLEGEAFFEVRRNPGKPFIVHYGTMQTTVLGTSFNISAYPQVNKNIVSVRSGKVQVSDATKTLGVLKKDNELIYETGSRKSSVRASKWQEATGWMDGNLVFRESGKEEIRLRLEHYFGVSVDISDDALSDATTALNAVFVKGSTLPDVLETISLMTGTKYTINNKKVTITN